MSYRVSSKSRSIARAAAPIAACLALTFAGACGEAGGVATAPGADEPIDGGLIEIPEDLTSSEDGGVQTDDETSPIHLKSIKTGDYDDLVMKWGSGFDTSMGRVTAKCVEVDSEPESPTGVCLLYTSDAADE